MNLRNDLSTRRGVMTIVIVIAVILIIAAIGYFSGNWEATPP